MESSATYAIVQTLTKAIVEHRLHPGTKLAEHVLTFNNTVTWQFRYEPVPGAYTPVTAERVMDSLTDQMRAVQDMRTSR